MSFKNGYKIGTMDSRSIELSKLFTGRDGTIQLEPKKYTLTSCFANHADALYDFQFFEDDVILYTFPKSGTTWCQELIWTLLLNGNLDNPEADTPLTERSACFDWHCVFSNFPTAPSVVRRLMEKCPEFDQSEGGLAIQVAKMTPRPRVIKLHLPMSLCSRSIDKAKVVCVLRDPRDVCISYYHHCRLFLYHNYVGDFDQFVDAFIENANVWGPYWEHVKEAWEKRNQENVYVCYFENFKRYPHQEYKKLAEFLGKELNEEQIQKIVHYTSFSEMKKRDHHVLADEDRATFMNMALSEKQGGFFRQGTSGGWRKVLTQQQKDKFEAWIKNNCPDQEIMRNITGE